MKAFQILGPNQSNLTVIPEPTCEARDVILQAEFIGLCGSDLSTFAGRNALVQYPRIPGHEISALIVQRGAEVPDTLKVGMRVAVVPYTSCGVCSACVRGKPNACRANKTLGVQQDGALTERIAVPWQNVLVAGNLSPRELVFVEPLSVGFHAIDRANVKDNDTVLVLGCGMIGLGAIAGASLRAARTIGADIDDTKLSIATKFGAQYTINAQSTNLHEAVSDLTDGSGPDVVVEAAGNARTYSDAFKLVSFAGRVACIGYTSGEVPLATRLFVQKELDILGSRNATRFDFESPLRQLEKRAIPVEHAISEISSTRNLSRTFESWAAEPDRFTKILVDTAQW